VRDALFYRYWRTKLCVISQKNPHSPAEVRVFHAPGLKQGAAIVMRWLLPVVLQPLLAFLLFCSVNGALLLAVS
jgi:hypothetical protein